MMTNLFVNGRYLTQPLTGVQRFAVEITAALKRQAPGRVIVLGPNGADRNDASVRVIGRRTGQMWEQFELPPHAANGVLINLGNTAPLWLRSQVVVIHDAGVFATPEAYSWRFRSWYKFAQKRLVNRGVRVATVSEFSRWELMRCLGVKPDHISVISEGADHMHDIAADYGAVTRLPHSRFVLAVGNLAAHKNLASLSELAARLARRNVGLVITGGLASGPYATARRDVLPQPACYPGRVSDGELKALYERAACLVFPSRYEGFGLPAVEAMACRCPVVASRIPALRETCGDAAHYFDPGSPTDIAEQVCRLLDDRTLESDLRAASLARIRQFSWARAAKRLADVADGCHAGNS
jgi:glycosyltransferase involved in cell wall biosynthesis